MHSSHSRVSGGALRRGLFYVGLVLVGSAVNASAAEFSWSNFLGPFHNVVLHYPVGFVTMACLLELYGWRSNSEELRRIILFTLWLSIISTLAAALLGFARASDGGYNEQTLSSHEIFGIATIVLGVAALLVARVALKTGAAPAARWGYRFMLLSTFAVMSLTGHKGGDLTHGSGYLTKHAPPILKDLLGEGDGAPSTVRTPSRTMKENKAAAVGEVSKTGLFASKVWPAFELKCVKCHGEEKHKGDYRLDTRDFALTPGESGEKPIVPGKPDASFLVKLIMLSEDDDEVMPPSGKEPLSTEEKAAIRQWIQEGAAYE